MEEPIRLQPILSRLLKLHPTRVYNTLTERLKTELLRPLDIIETNIKITKNKEVIEELRQML